MPPTQGNLQIEESYVPLQTLKINRHKVDLHISC
jgi:hypothetical protein